MQLEERRLCVPTAATSDTPSTRRVTGCLDTRWLRMTPSLRHIQVTGVQSEVLAPSEDNTLNSSSGLYYRRAHRAGVPGSADRSRVGGRQPGS